MWFKKAHNNAQAISGGESFTFLGKGAHCQGIISFEGTIRIDGRLEGEIHVKGTLVVGEHAVIEGDVNADVAIVGGRVAGAIIAREKVQLLSSGVVLGTITTPVLLVEEGARFMGACEAAGWGEVKALDGGQEVLPHPPQAVTQVRGA